MVLSSTVSLRMVPARLRVKYGARVTSVRLSETNGQVNADDNDVTAGEKPKNGLEDNVIGEEKEEKVPEAADEVSEEVKK